EIEVRMREVDTRDLYARGKPGQPQALLEDEECLLRGMRGAWSGRGVRAATAWRHLSDGTDGGAAERTRDEAASGDECEEVHAGDGTLVKRETQRSTGARPLHVDRVICRQPDRIHDDAPPEGIEADAADSKPIDVAGFLRNRFGRFRVQQMIGNPRRTPPQATEQKCREYRDPDD